MNKQKQRQRHKQQEVEIIGFSIIILLVIVGVFTTIASNFNTSTSSQTDSKNETSNKDTPSKSYVGHSPQLEDYDRNQISSIILAVSCGAYTGAIPRSKMGTTIKKMINEKGYNPTKVYNNWDYYWKRAKEMDRVNGTNCLG